MALSLVYEILNPLFVPVSEDLLQVPQRPLPQHPTLLLSSTLPLLPDEFPKARDSLVDEVLPRRLPHTAAEDIPPHRPGSHLVPNVSWVIDQLEDGVRRVISLAVAVFVDTSVTPRSVDVALGKLPKDFRNERRLENKSVGFPVSRQATLLAKGYHLRPTCQIQKARFLE